MKLIDSIKLHEGYVSRVYKDSLGIDTIGYGFAIKDLNLAEDICHIILQRKLELLEKNINKRFDWYKDMPQPIKDVVAEMCYQMGVTGVSNFKKTITFLKNKQWRRASVEMLDSRWANQTPGRANELSERVKEME